MTDSPSSAPDTGEFPMDELILRGLSGSANDLDMRRIEHWRAERPENERRFVELEMIWGATARPQIPLTLLPDAVMSEAQSRSHVGLRGRFSRTLGAHRVWPWGLVAAAIAAVALGVARGGAGLFESGAAVAGGFELIASSGSQTESLPDGSFVRLGPQSRIRFVASENQREVWLTGRAFFGVTHQPDRPFVVHTDRGSTRVLGTRFEVSELESELRIVVVEGRVRVEVPSGNQLDVPGGQIARVGDDGDLSVESVDEVFDYLDWDGGLLLFQETPVAQVAREVGLHFGADVRILDPTIADRSITAWFSDESLPEVIETICLLIGADCSSDGTRVTLGN